MQTFLNGNNSYSMRYIHFIYSVLKSHITKHSPKLIRRLGSTTCVLLLSTLPTSQAQTIFGTILDKTSGKPVPYIAVYEKNSALSTLSDHNGHFTLNSKRTKKTEITIAHTSYETQTISFRTPLKDSTLQIFIQEKVNQLQGIKVTASALRQELTQSFSQTNLDELLIQEKIATALIDILEQAPGITKQGEYHSPIVLRGLGGKRLLITKDGNRRMGNFSGGFMGQGVNIYDLAKVEVIKGPASVMYGPGAITGIINMESKYPFLTPGWHGKLATSYGTNNHEKTTQGTLNWANMDNALSISARYRNADEYKAGNGITMQNSYYKDKDLRVSYSHENNSSLTLTAESELHLGGPWGRPVGFSGTNYMRVTNTADNTWHSSITAVWQPELKLKKIEASVYYDQEYRRQLKDSYDVGSGKLSYREDVSYRNFYAGWREKTIFTLNKKTQLNIGTDGVYYRIQSPTQLTDYFLSTVINNRVSKDAGVSLSGLFAETEYRTYHNRLKFRAGLRGDYSNINEGDVHDTLQASGRKSNVWAWNGTSGVVYTVRPNIFLSFQAARSCRMPDATEMFIITSNTDGIVYGNSSLKPEYGLNLDAGLRGIIGICSFDCSLFSNFLNDFISLEYWTNSGKKGINYTYYNIDKARIIGAEISIGAKWNHVFHPDNKLNYNGSYVITRGDKLTDEPGWFGNGVPLRDIPPFNTTQEITFRRVLNSSKSFYLGGDIRYYATQNRIAPSADGGYISYAYCLFGASAGYTYQKNEHKWELKFKADNLANNKYRAFETLVYSMGRNFKLMGSVTF